PGGVAFSSSSVPYNSVSGSTYRWIFTNVMPGAHSFTVTAQVTANTTDGQVLSNVAALTYTDQLSRSLPGSQAWANTTVSRQVNPGFTGSQLVNWAFLNYTTAGGYALTGSRSSAVVAIPELQDMIFVALVPLVIVGLKWRAQRREK